MNLFALSGLLTAITCLSLALFVLIKHRGKKLNKIWAAFTLSGGLWGIGVYKIATTLDPSNALKWWKFAHIGVIFLPILFVHFLYELLEIKQKVFLIFIYIIGIFFLLLNFFTSLFIKNMRVVFSSFYYDSPPGKIYPLFVIFFFGIITYGHYKLYIGYKKSTEIKKIQLKYFFWATVIGFSGGGTCFLPVFKIDIYPILNFGIPIYSIVITYAIVKHQLMDIKLAITRATVFTFVYGFTFGVPFLIFYLFKKQIHSLYMNYPWSIPSSLIGYAALATITPFIYIRLERKAYYALFGDYSGQLQVLRETSREIIEKGFENATELARLIPTHIMNFYENTMRQKVKNAFYLLREGGHFIPYYAQVKSENSGGSMNINQNDPLIKWFMDTREQMVHERIIKSDDNNYSLKKDDIETWLENIAGKERFNALKNELIALQDEISRLNGVVFLPSYYKDELMGILALGEKQGGNYRTEELNVFHTMAENAAMVFKGAQLTASVLEAEKIKEIEQAKSEFFSNVSHELRTPLTNIIPPVELCLSQEEENLPPHVKNILHGILLNSKKLLKEINKLLDISKLEAGKMRFKYALTDINSLLRVVIEPARELAKTKNLRLLEDYAPDLQNIYADTEYLSKTFSNLLNNALKFTPDNGAITIKTEDDNDGDYIRILVSDTGIGIDEKDLPYIFDRFRQADGSTSRKFEGTGIGLSLAKEIVDLHRGEIGVSSTKEKGSTFTIRLPKGRAHLVDEEIVENVVHVIENAVHVVENIQVLENELQDERRKKDRRQNPGRRQDDNEQEYAASLQYVDLMSSAEENSEDIIPDPARKGSGEKFYKVLVIEDNKDLAINLRNMLTAFYKVSIAYNGNTGLEKIVQEPPDIVISDIMMPEMDGFTLCKQLKTNPKTKLIPVILLTAKAKVEDRIAGIEYGADAYLTKPFHYRELLASVSSLIREGELKRSLKEKNEALEMTMQELKGTQAQLVHAAKLASVGQLAAGVAHEVHNPASAIDNCFQIIRKRIEKMKNNQATLDDIYPDLTKFVELGKISLHRIQNIVDSLLGFSRKNKEGVDFVDIHEGIENTLALLEHQYEREIQIHKEYGQFEKIEADLQQLNQVFMNLFTNAIYAIQVKKKQGLDSGHIWIKTTGNGDHVNITIKDNGIGIPHVIQDKLFDPFFTTKPVGQGTGLGLNISYRIIKDHQGTISVESEENEGTTFTITIPKRMGQGASVGV